MPQQRPSCRALSPMQKIARAYMFVQHRQSSDYKALYDVRSARSRGDDSTRPRPAEENFARSSSRANGRASLPLLAHSSADTRLAAVSIPASRVLELVTELSTRHSIPRLARHLVEAVHRSHPRARPKNSPSPTSQAALSSPESEQPIHSLPHVVLAAIFFAFTGAKTTCLIRRHI